MRLKPVFILFLLVHYTPLKADYVPYSLDQLIFKAEQIVYGEIIAMDSLSYQLKVEKSVLEPLDTIEVRRFKNWACAWRWTEYAVGQRVFLFLRKHKDRYFALSAGNEGEMPVLHDSVYINLRSFGNVPLSFERVKTRAFYNKAGYKARVNQLYGAPFRGFKVSLNLFFYSVKSLRKYFTISYSKERYYPFKVTNVQQNVKQHRMDLAIRRSSVFKWVYDRLMT